MASGRLRQDPPIRIDHRILVRMVVPILAAGLLFSWVALHRLTEPLVGYLQNEADLLLKHASEHGLTICDQSLNHLLEMRLEEDDQMNAALQHETLAEIRAIHRRLPKIHMLVIDTHGAPLTSSLNSTAGLPLPNPDSGFSDQISDARINGVPMRLHRRYFPFWRWWVVSLISRADYNAPVVMARRAAWMATLGVVATLLFTLVLVFRIFVARPLNRLIDAAGEVASGHFAPVTVRRPDEIGRLSEAFNSMIEVLKQRAQQNNELIQVLTASERRFRAAFETSPDALILTRMDDHTIVEVNDGFCRLTGYAMKEVVGSSPLELGIWVAPDDRQRLVQRLAAGETVREFEAELRCKDGRVGTAMLAAVPLIIAGEDYLLTIARDVSAQVAALRALSESEARYRLVVENANDAIFVILDGRIRFANCQAERLIGYDQQILSSRDFLEFVHPDDRRMVAERQQLRSAGQDPPRHYALRLVHAGGQVRYGQLSVVAIEWEGRPATLGFLRDITTEKSLEDQFQQAQRLEAIGTLAGGIAHDFNNLLMGIQGNAALALGDIGAGHAAAERLNNIEDLVQNGVTLTRQLLGFARGGKYEVRPTDLNRMLERHHQIFGRTKREVRIEGIYEKNLWPVAVDRGQIEQVLLNLYVNAWQAMPGGGDIRVTTRNMEVDSNEARIHGVTAGRYIRLDVRDSGVGMDEAVMQRIFDPFFTTKEREWGTGLGLASVYGIMKNHGGFVTVVSRPGHGATFSLFLPASDAAPEQIAPHPHRVRPGQGTVLLVDDDEMILDVGRGLLESLGYRVLHAASGREAIAVLEAATEPVELVLLDLIMPDMGGGEVFDRIRKRFPAIRVVLSSGYSINGEAADIMARGCEGFLQKPFGREALCAKLQEVLGA